MKCYDEKERIENKIEASKSPGAYLQGGERLFKPVNGYEPTTRRRSRREPSDVSHFLSSLSNATQAITVIIRGCKAYKQFMKLTKKQKYGVCRRDKK